MVTFCVALVVPVFCVAKVRAVGLTVIVVGTSCPIPLKLTDCGEPLALSAMVREAVRVPAADGLKVTLIEQVALTASDGPQVLASIKSAAFVPASPMELSVIGWLPVLEITVLWAVLVVPVFWAGNVREAGLTESVVRGTRPEPTRLTVCGEPKALSVMLRLAARVPAAVGLKMTLMAHDCLSKSRRGQLLVVVKSAALVPPMATELKNIGKKLLGVKVIVWAELATPIFCAANVKELGLTVTVSKEGGVCATATPAAPSVPIASRVRRFKRG